MMFHKNKHSNPPPEIARRRWLRTSSLVAMILALSVGIIPASTVQAQEPDPQDTSLYLPLINYQTKDCLSLKTPTKFGVQTYGNTGKNTEYFQSMTDSGATWLRVETTWGAAEPQNVAAAQFNWTVTDNAMRAAGDGCMNVIFTHDGNPAWAATSPSGPVDKAPLSELAEYLAAAVERYDGDGFQDAPGAPEVHYFELYNEPDRGTLPNAPGWGDHAVDYAAMLEAVYPAMKAASPKVKVLLGGIAYDNFIGEEPEGGFVKSFLPDVLDAGGGNHFDMMNFHYYPLFAGRWTSSSDGSKGIGLFEKTQAVRAVLQQRGLSKPIVVTEGGWHSNADQPPASSEAEQAVYAFHIFMQSYAAAIDFTIWWTLYDIDYNFYPFRNGLVGNTSESNPPRRKQSFNVYQVMTSQVAPLNFIQKLPDAATGSNLVEAYHFAGDRTVYAVWVNPTLTSTTKTFSIPASQVTERDMFWGVVKKISDGDDGRTDGRVRITVSGAPKYFEVNG